MKRATGLIVTLAALLVVILFAWQYGSDAGSNQPGVAVADKAAQIAHGAYLVRAADCMACHTARGAAPFAGGRAIATPFGNLYAPNITPDAATGLGRWSADDFWRALHNGKSRDGQFLYPAFPYPNYTRIARAESDAMFAYLQSLPPVTQPNRPHELRFPYSQRPLLAFWRALYFRAGVYQPDPDQSVAWNRGAYLVQGLGHCNACHAERNVLGATANTLSLAGGLIPVLDWYAPPLAGSDGGLASWSQQDLADFLQSGISMRATASGPMAEVISASLQYLNAADIDAIALYLKAQPQAAEKPSGLSPTAPKPKPDLVQQALLQRGSKLYRDHCIDCHQSDGSGMPPHYPALAGNPSVTLAQPTNAIRIVLNGGFPPSTSANPRPYGMPPFGPGLTDQDVAAVLSFVRSEWGNQALPISAAQVRHHRATSMN